MHVLAPGGRLEDLTTLTRDDLPRAGLSPTHMEAIQGFDEWYQRGIPPAVGFTMWYLESVQRPDGSFLRTEDASMPSIGVAIRFLQIAAHFGVHRDECESVEGAAAWLEGQLDSSGLIRMPVSGLVDYGMLGRTVRALVGVSSCAQHEPAIERASDALVQARLADDVWPTYPEGKPSTGATSHAVMALAESGLTDISDADLSWLLSVQNADGGWGEYEGSPSQIDNTFWTYRACQLVAPGAALVPSADLREQASEEAYEIAMRARLGALAGWPPEEELTGLVFDALTDDADRYAKTALHGLAAAEQNKRADLVTESAKRSFPVRTPEFIRREPPLYDELAELTSYGAWMRFVDWTARSRVAENSIGWLAGLSAAIAVTSEELVGGLSAIGTAPLIAVLVVEALLMLGWVASRQQQRQSLRGIPHLGFALLIAVLVVLLIRSPPEVEIPPLATVVLLCGLGLLVEVVSVATDKADLLNRIAND